MPELPPGFDPPPSKDECPVCKTVIVKWYCEACDEWAFDCGCRQHRDETEHREMMEARRR